MNLCIDLERDVLENDDRMLGWVLLQQGLNIEQGSKIETSYKSPQEPKSSVGGKLEKSKSADQKVLKNFQAHRRSGSRPNILNM